MTDETGEGLGSRACRHWGRARNADRVERVRRDTPIPAALLYGLTLNCLSAFPVVHDQGHSLHADGASHSARQPKGRGRCATSGTSNSA